MAEKAFGKIGRVVCLVLLTIEHFGVGCVLIVLIAQVYYSFDKITAII